MPYPTQQRMAHMGTMLDIQDLPDDRVEYLKNLIALWRKQEGQEKKKQTRSIPTPIVKRKVSPDEFIVKKSHVIGGTMTRAMAYDDD